MKWTKTPPSEPGWYWCYKENKNLCMTKITQWKIDEFKKGFYGYMKFAHWLGPLPVPDAPEEEQS